MKKANREDSFFQPKFLDSIAENGDIDDAGSFTPLADYVGSYVIKI